MLVSALAANAQSGVEEVDLVMRALEDELARSMKELRLGDLERPYFLAYRLDDTHSVSVEASLGSLLSTTENRRRYLHVELRVGGYDFDNTNFFSIPSFGSTGLVATVGATPLPLDDDYREIRRQAWLATDAAYKTALEDLARKRAALRNKTLTDEIPDLSRAERVVLHDGTPRPELDRAGGERLAKRLSEVFQKSEVAISKASYDAASIHTRYINSEGTVYTRTLSDVMLAARAAVQAEDGRWIDDASTAFGRHHDDLGEEGPLMRGAEALARDLERLRAAELAERYNGPVLFEAAAAAEILAQIFVPKLLAQRRPVADHDLTLAPEESDFKDRLGARVLPRFLSLIDHPGARGQGLFGGFPVDDEGVVGTSTRLVERGFLKTLLASRTPVVGVEVSSGNARAGGVAPSNLTFQVEHDGRTIEELKRELLSWVADRGAEFGILISRVAQPHFRIGPSASSPLAADGDAPVPVTVAYKIFPDGKKVLVRNAEITGLSARSFREIVAASSKCETFHRPFRVLSGNPLGGFRQEIPLISLTVPALLMEEVTLRVPSGEIPQPPALPHPLIRY